MEAMHADGMHVHTWEWSTALIKSERNPVHMGSIKNVVESWSVCSDGTHFELVP